MASKHSRKSNKSALGKKTRAKLDVPSSPHKSFKRTYREDCQRELEVPGIMQHLVEAFKIIFKNWRLFVPLLILAVVLNVALVGIMNQATYVQFQETIDQANIRMNGEGMGSMAKATAILLHTVATGGLAGGSSEAATIFGVLIFLLLWLTAIFLVRHILAGYKIKLRDGLYNAMTPLVSTFVVVVVAAVESIPLFLLLIAYSAAVQTDFLAMPFYALMFLGFAVLMVILSGYLLSSTLMALVAVTAPGLYPGKALKAAADLMMGRRIKMIIRLIALIIAMVAVWAVVMIPLIMFDLGMKNFEWAAGIPFVPVCLNIMGCFTIIYIAVYLYLYYRWVLEYEK